MKKNNNKGFTLAELLIVVAIIAVLVAIAIPVFTTQLERARETADLANLRSAYGELVTEYLSQKLSADDTLSATVPVTQRTAGWQTLGSKSASKALIGTSIKVDGSSTTAGVAIVARKSGDYRLIITGDGHVYDSADNTHNGTVTPAGG